MLHFYFKLLYRGIAPCGRFLAVFWILLFIPLSLVMGSVFAYLAWEFGQMAADALMSNGGVSVEHYFTLFDAVLWKGLSVYQVLIIAVLSDAILIMMYAIAMARSYGSVKEGCRELAKCREAYEYDYSHPGKWLGSIKAIEFIDTKRLAVQLKNDTFFMLNYPLDQWVKISATGGVKGSHLHQISENDFLITDSPFFCRKDMQQMRQLFILSADNEGERHEL